MSKRKLEDTGFYKKVFSPAFKGSLMFIMIAAVLMVLIFKIWYHNYIIKLVNEVHVLQEELVDLKIERDRQLSIIIRKESYPRILKYATEKLGLIPAVDKPIEFKVPKSEYEKLHKQGS